MLKYAGALLIVAASAAVGIALKLRGQRRIESLRAVETMLARLRAEITSLHTPVREIFASLARESTGEASQFFADAAGAPESGARAQTFSEAFADAVRAHGEAMSLTPPERAALLDLAPVLGRTDAAGQESAISLAEERLRDSIVRETDEKSRRDRLYLPVSLSAGIALAVLLV